MSDKLSDLIDLFDKVLAPAKPTRDGAAYVWTFVPRVRKDGIMSNQKTIAYTAPVKREVLDDPQLFSTLVNLLMLGARTEAIKACEGRNYTIDSVRMVVTDNGPSFTRNLLDAELQITITPAD